MSGYERFRELKELEYIKNEFTDIPVAGNTIVLSKFMEQIIKLIKEIDYCQVGIMEGVKSLIGEQDKLKKRVKTLEEGGEYHD